MSSASDSLRDHHFKSTNSTIALLYHEYGHRLLSIGGTKCNIIYNKFEVILTRLCLVEFHLVNILAVKILHLVIAVVMPPA